MDIIKHVDNSTCTPMKLKMFLVIFPAAVCIKNTICVVGQFWGYFILNVLLFILLPRLQSPLVMVWFI